ncbi:(R)-phenyllactate dehydratase activator [BD1-7 clade bacterium]|uniref:(R)-phenyllactate dehydratase activator n=1 Tax=BD1-7 clade bacterium TaxID=2029982 RepID=A0A5S9QWT2_9GAMM|nr:(R)-phenyllactate dehydratase activator [BD1-7 clade bacterium]
MQPLAIGIDIGSTTVKAVVVDTQTKTILWHDYLRHNTRQPQLVAEFLTRIRDEFPDRTDADFSVFVTGSGAGPIGPLLGARFVQEVNAVTMAVEHLYPDVGSVIELGGQDAKIIIFKTHPKTGERQAVTSMNDKCASGTGATIDKCMIKVGLKPEDVSGIRFNGDHLHHVAAKCGVFAETDIVNLVKSAVPADEIMCSLADAIVMQNLSVLTRGNTLNHKVLLLGGPNTYLTFLQECWRLRIPETWRDRGYEYPEDMPLDELIQVPPNAELFAALGAVLFGLQENIDATFSGIDELEAFIHNGRQDRLAENCGPALSPDELALQRFKNRYRIPTFKPAQFQPGQQVHGFLGLDGGSTSSKCVVVDNQGEVLLKAYQLSKGNPIQDMIDMLGQLKQQVQADGATLNIDGFGVTGYAADVLETALDADVNIVETIAHMMSATHYFDNADVICDIGGQDIKVLMLNGDELKNFRLSNQCSAGNGMLLQAMADQFGVPVVDYADHAFEAGLSPKFSYGCAVFLDSDRVNFQKEGYNKEELMAGLAMVLPKNVWQYVAQIPRLAELGKTFVLQGGTQYNLAAVKAQVDYIEERVPNANVCVHPHPGEAGAIGAALEAREQVSRRGHSTFVGLEQAIALNYTTQNDATTTCTFCANHCSRTFIDTETSGGKTARYISGFSCEKGTVEDKPALKVLERERKQRMTHYPNLVNTEANLCFKHFYNAEALPSADTTVTETVEYRGWNPLKKDRTITRAFERSNDDAVRYRQTLRIGMPKVLNMWSTGPFWRTYFEALGISKGNLVFSDDTSEAMFAEGGKYGSIDPCYPAKVAQAHIHNLLFHKHTEKRPVDYLYFPTITHIPSFVDFTMDTASCPIVAGTPNVIKAAFTKEVDFFARKGITYVDAAVSMNEPNLLKKQLFDTWGDKLRITEDENNFAVAQAWKALDTLDEVLQTQGRELIEHLEANGRMGILLLGRPYHNDPGLNHEITEEYQALGYPILSIRSIPKDPAWLNRYFADDIEQQRIASATDIRDVWPENYSANSVQKVWAAKFAARHPNIAVLDLSSFKCGNDAPTYGIIDNIIGTAGAPYSAMHDIDANKPQGSMKIRVKTYAHTLKKRQYVLQEAAGVTPEAVDEPAAVEIFTPPAVAEFTDTKNQLIDVVDISHH